MQELNFKFIVVGDSSVGKTALINRYLSGEYSSSPKDHKPTASPNSLSKTFKEPNRTIEVQIWDIPENDKSQATDSRLYLSADACFICVDLTTVVNQEKVKEYYDKIRANNSKTPIFLVGTKADESLQQTNPNDLDTIAAKLGCEKLVLLVSAKTGVEVNELFEGPVDKLLHNAGQPSLAPPNSEAEQPTPPPAADPTRKIKQPRNQNAQSFLKAVGLALLVAVVVALAVFYFYGIIFGLTIGAVAAAVVLGFYGVKTLIEKRGDDDIKMKEMPLKEPSEKNDDTKVYQGGQFKGLNHGPASDSSNNQQTVKAKEKNTDNTDEEDLFIIVKAQNDQNPESVDTTLKPNPEEVNSTTTTYSFH